MVILAHALAQARRRRRVVVVVVVGAVAAAMVVRAPLGCRPLRQGAGPPRTRRLRLAQAGGAPVRSLFAHHGVLRLRPSSASGQAAPCRRLSAGRSDPQPLRRSGRATFSFNPLAKTVSCDAPHAAMCVCMPLPVHAITGPSTLACHTVVPQDFKKPVRAAVRHAAGAHTL